MPHKLFRMQKAGQAARDVARPVMLAIAGDSAAGKTTITRGLVEALGPDRCTAVCVDDYHRYDRAERRDKPFTALHPECNYLQIMEQHLQLLAMGQPVLKPVYDHHTGQLGRPVLVEPREFVIIEGLLPLRTKLARACFDATVYLDPPEDIRRSWKVKRDTAERGYAAPAVLAELDQREPESAAFIRPQRAFADIVIRFAPLPGRVVPAGTPLSAELLLRPTIRHPDLDGVVPQDVRDNGARPAIHLKLARDADGRPVDALHIHGDAVDADSEVIEKAIWSRLGAGSDPPSCLGRISDGQRNAPLAITQLLLLYHLLDAARLSRFPRLGASCLSALVAGLVVGVGEAGVDGVVQVEVLAVPGGDDGVRGDLGVVAVLDGPFRAGEGGTGGQEGSVGAVEGDGAAGPGGDEVAAVVDERVVMRAQAQEVVQAGLPAVAPVLDVVQVDPAGLTPREPAPAVVPVAGGPPLRGGRAPAAPPGVQDGAVPAVPHPAQRGRAGKHLGGGDADRGAVLDVAAGRIRGMTRRLGVTGRLRGFA